MSYCEFTKNLDQNHPDKKYHDENYGFPLKDDNELFGRLILEINQAGLSWSQIIKREPAFRKAFENYDISVVAAYKEKKIIELMNDAGIIRNRKKIEAVIYNANKILEIQKNNGTFSYWLDKNLGLSLEEWTKLFKNNFKFTGIKIVEEFLMSTGYLDGAHTKDCKIYKDILKKKPKWADIK